MAENKNNVDLDNLTQYLIGLIHEIEKKQAEVHLLESYLTRRKVSGKVKSVTLAAYTLKHGQVIELRIAEIERRLDLLQMKLKENEDALFPINHKIAVICDELRIETSE